MELQQMEQELLYAAASGDCVAMERLLNQGVRRNT